MIITVTLNPAIDKTIMIDRLTPGKLNRVKEVITLPGGKGINVAQVIHQMGENVLTTGILGGNTGDAIKTFLRKKKLKADFISSNYATRQNIKILETSISRETEINEPGKVSKNDFKALEKKLRDYLAVGNLIVMAGSIPHGLSSNTYNHLIRLCKEAEIPVIVDTSGNNLKEVLKEQPFLIKPNLHEAQELIGEEIKNEKDMKKTANYFLAQGVEIIVISMGARGAIFANKKNCYYLKTPQVSISNTTVGAGDSMVAGLAVALQKNMPFKEIACYAAAIATSYVKLGKIELLNKEMIKKTKEKITIKII